MSRARHAAASVAGFLLTLAAAGCESTQLMSLVTAGPDVRIRSIGEDPVIVGGNFITSFYSHVGGVEATYVLSDQPLEKLLNDDVRNGQVLHIELLWEPMPGRTPMNPAVTNASVRYVVIAGGEVGVYGGSGFVLPKGDLGSRRSSLTIVNASLKLLESTNGFKDLLTAARLSGTISARLDPRSTQSLRFAASQVVTNALGVSRFVRSGDDPLGSTDQNEPFGREPLRTATVAVAAAVDR